MVRFTFKTIALYILLHSYFYQKMQCENVILNFPALDFFPSKDKKEIISKKNSFIPNPFALHSTLTSEIFN